MIRIMTASPVRLWRALLLAGFGLLLMPADARAQTAQERVTFLYGVSGGAGRRTTDGTFAPSALPPGAAPVESGRTISVLTLEAGAGVGRRFAAIGLYDQTFGGNSSAGHWGTMSGSAVARFWLIERFWVEAGGGFAELGYKAPDDVPNRITRYWAPGFAAGVGAEVLKGRRVSITTLVRYTRATFEGLTVNNLTFQVGLLGRE